MKIVIEVSEKDYLAFCLQFDNGILDEKTPSHRAKIAIAEGTPLPKGHGRLIDADAVLEDPIGDTYKDIDIAETIIEADKEGAEE